MKEKKGFLFYYKWAEILSSLPSAIRYEILDAIIIYNMENRIPELSPSANLGFQFILKDIEEEKKKSEQNRKNVSARWKEGNLFEENTKRYESIQMDTKVYETIQSNTNFSKDNEKERNKEKEKENIKENIKEKNLRPRKCFVKPSIQEIESYIQERGSLYINPHHFYDFYESKNWMVGKNKMKDWKAAVRTWERNHKMDMQKNIGYQNNLNKYALETGW